MPINRNYIRRNIFLGLRITQRKVYLTYLIVGLISGFILAPILLNPIEYKSLDITTLNFFNGFKDQKPVKLHTHVNENRTMADELFKKVRILCWIMTKPDNHMEKAIHVKQTWGKRCNKLLFMSTAKDDRLGTVALPMTEGRGSLWGKTKEAFKYIYKYHLNDFDWFLKADDDTYVVVENLRYMLYAYSPEYPVLLGCKFKNELNKIYMSGGAGYVLSREAVKLFIEKAVNDPDKCRQENDRGEDYQLGICLENVGVLAGDSRDEFARGRFFPFPAHDHLCANPKADFWYWDYIYFKTDEGLDCCSDHAISFHYIKPKDLYTLDYLIYHLKPFGIKYKLDVLPKRKLLDDVIQDAAIPSNNNRTGK